MMEHGKHICTGLHLFIYASLYAHSELPLHILKAEGRQHDNKDVTRGTKSILMVPQVATTQ